MDSIQKYPIHTATIHLKSFDTNVRLANTKIKGGVCHYCLFGQRYSSSLHDNRNHFNSHNKTIIMLNYVYIISTHCPFNIVKSK